MSGVGHRAVWAHRGRVLEAAGLMAAGAAAQRWVPMPRWSGVLGRAREVPDAWRGRTVHDIPELAADGPERDVAVAVDRALAHLPVAPSCLAQAFAGQVMLRRRGRGGVVVIGLRRGADRWDAHAWLLGSLGALTGGPAAAGFTATTVFEAPGGLRATEVPIGEG